MENLTGKQLGAYHVLAPLGKGGMAAVYKAYQPSMDRTVALKVLPRHYADDPQFEGRFRQEAHLIAQLQHPHIIPVFDFGQADGYSFLVMPLINGGTLLDSLCGRPLPFKQICDVISQIGDALDYAHGCGIVHRDIKPSNVLIDERGNCLLADFGLARIFDATTQYTASGALLGTPAYMSPEQSRGEKSTPRSDLYALGVILYEMATGSAPYSAETPAAVMIKHILEPLTPPRQVNPLISERLERVILKSMAKDAADRFATAGQMVAALQAAFREWQNQDKAGQTMADRPQSNPSVTPASASPSTSHHAVPAALPEKKVPRRLLTVVSLIVVGLLVVVGGSLWWSRRVSPASLPATPNTDQPALAGATVTLAVASPTQVATNVLPTSGAPTSSPSDTVAALISTPQELSTPTDRISAARMAFDPAGRLHVVWQAYDGQRRHVFHRLRQLDGQWSDAETLTGDFDNVQVSYLQLVLSPQGPLCALFDVMHNRWYQRCFQDGMTGPVEKVAEESGELAFAYAPDGMLHYLVYPGVSQKILYENILLAEGGGLYGDLALVIDSAGRYHAFWTRMEINQGSHLEYRRSEDGGKSWQSLQELTPLETQAVWHDTMVRTDLQGLGLLFRTSQLYFRRWLPGSDWGELQMMAAENDPRLVALAMDTHGRAQVTWVETDGLYFSRQTAEGTWTPPAFLANLSVNSTSSPQIMAKADGGVVILWVERQDNQDRIRIAEEQ